MLGSPWQPKCCKWCNYYFYARSLTTPVLISLRLQMFQWSFDATHMKRTYRCAHVCDARCQFWRPQAPTLASHRTDAGLAEDLSPERLPGKRQPTPNKFSSSDRETQRNKQGAKKGGKRMRRFFIFFYCLCIRLEKWRKTIAAGRVIYSKYPPPVFRGTLGTTANTTNQRGVISNFFGHWISRGKKKANSFSYWRWQKKLVCCRESAEIGHFNVVMETRCMWQSRR